MPSWYVIAFVITTLVVMTALSVIGKRKVATVVCILSALFAAGILLTARAEECSASSAGSDACVQTVVLESQYPNVSGGHNHTIVIAPVSYLPPYNGAREISRKVTRYDQAIQEASSMAFELEKNTQAQVYISDLFN